MKRLIVERPEIPKDGWFHNTLMEKLLGREMMELENYPLKNGHWFITNRNDHDQERHD